MLLASILNAYDRARDHWPEAVRTLAALLLADAISHDAGPFLTAALLDRNTPRDPRRQHDDEFY